MNEENTSNCSYLTEYQKKQFEALNYLNAERRNLLTLIINLAATGKWSKWNDSKDIGSTFIFTDKMLRRTGDKNVDMLIRIFDLMSIVAKQIDNQIAGRIPHDQNQI